VIGDAIGNFRVVRRLDRWLAALVIVLSASRAYADATTAAAAFKQAEELKRQNKWAEACPLFEASYNADPQLGVLLNLADCNEHIGRTATAWAELNDAIGLAHSKQDARREALARKHADALAPKLAKLKVKAPAKLIPGLVVKRGTVDITALVGSEIPIDPGDHEIIASAPGYVESKQKVTIAPSSTSDLEIPALEKVVEKPVETAPVIHDGTLKITTAPNAQIILDNEVAGTGSVERKVKSGGHTLRIVAGGMRPYQSEVFVGDGEARVIDIPLEKEVVATPIIIAPPPEDRASFELATSIGTGIKNRQDMPLVINARVEAAFRFGKRVNFGVFGEYGTIDTSDRCGMDMPGPMPSTPYDFGPRIQFLKCQYVMPGLQLYVHVLPERRFDPYLGVAPAFRFGFARWRSYQGGVADGERTEFLPAIVTAVRAGLDYHAKPKGWVIGGYVEGSITDYGDEASDQYDRKGQTYVTVFAGVRTGMVF